MFKSTKLTEDNIKRIVSLYLEGVSSLKLAEQFKVSKQYICKILNNYKVDLRGNRKLSLEELYMFEMERIEETDTKNAADINFFDNIETEEQAYFLGMLFAKGYNDEKRGKIVLSLREQDYEILRRLNKLIYKNKPLRFVESKYSNIKNHYTLEINSKHMSKRLAELGCTQKKDLSMIFPDPFTILKGDLTRHFIRGYLDGKSKFYIRKDLRVDYWIPTLVDFGKEIQFTLKYRVNVDTQLNLKDDQFYLYILGGDYETLKFLNWLYRDSKIHMNRKFKKFQKFKNNSNLLG